MPYFPTLKDVEGAPKELPRRNIKAEPAGSFHGNWYKSMACLNFSWCWPDITDDGIFFLQKIFTTAYYNLLPIIGPVLQ